MTKHQNVTLTGKTSFFRGEEITKITYIHLKITHVPAKLNILYDFRYVKYAMQPVSRLDIVRYFFFSEL